MRAYLVGHFPGVPADDVIQETLITLMQCMPNYSYNREEHGYFRNYLIGIVRHKAIRHLKLAARENEELEQYLRVVGEESSRAASEEKDMRFRQSVYELSLQELLADHSIQDRTKNIFIHVAINGENPEDVARNFGVTRNGVDQIKARMIAKLRKISDDLFREVELIPTASKPEEA